jgi:hypothetical protein
MVSKQVASFTLNNSERTLHYSHVGQLVLLLDLSGQTKTPSRRLPLRGDDCKAC